VTVLLALTERRRAGLRARAWPLGQRIYAERPVQFVGRIGAYRDAARSARAPAA